MSLKDSLDHRRRSVLQVVLPLSLFLVGVHLLEKVGRVVLLVEPPVPHAVLFVYLLHDLGNFAPTNGIRPDLGLGHLVARVSLAFRLGTQVGSDLDVLGLFLLNDLGVRGEQESLGGLQLRVTLHLQVALYSLSHLRDFIKDLLLRRADPLVVLVVPNRERQVAIVLMTEVGLTRVVGFRDLEG